MENGNWNKESVCLLLVLHDRGSGRDLPLLQEAPAVILGNGECVYFFVGEMRGETGIGESWSVPFVWFFSFSSLCRVMASRQETNRRRTERAPVPFLGVPSVNETLITAGLSSRGAQISIMFTYKAVET